MNFSNNVFEEVGSLDATVPLASATKLLGEGEGGIRQSTTKLLEDDNLRMIVEMEGRLEATSRDKMERYSDLAKQATLRTAAMEALQGMGEHKPLAETLVEFNSSRKAEKVDQRARVALQDLSLQGALAQKADVTSSPPQIATSKNSLIASQGNHSYFALNPTHISTKNTQSPDPSSIVPSSRKISNAYPVTRLPIHMRVQYL